MNDPNSVLYLIGVFVLGVAIGLPVVMWRINKRIAEIEETKNES